MINKKPAKLWLYFAGLIFATVFIVFTLISITWILFYQFGISDIDPSGIRAPLFLFLNGSLHLGGVITIFVGKQIIRPIQNIGKAFDALSHGDFTVKVSEDEKLEEIRDIAKRFNAMTYDLAHIETLRTDFVANVSHEFKTPLAAIEGYATLLQNPFLSREKQEIYIGKILENSRKLSTLSSNILMLSKLENQEIVAGTTEFRLDEQLRRCILQLETKWSAKGIEFDMDLPKQMYSGNEALLERVWSNLLDNAIKHSPQQGIIHICINKKSSSLSVCIADEGDGMSEEVQKHIFEKFYQGDSSRKSEGNGLGLSLVKRIVELSHGSITVTSTLGQGTTFTVTLPVSTK